MADLSTKTIAIIATDGFEDSELTSPADAVREAGATVKVIAPEAGTISGKKGASIDVDATLLMYGVRSSTESCSLVARVMQMHCVWTKPQWKS